MRDPVPNHVNSSEKQFCVEILKEVKIICENKENKQILTTTKLSPMKQKWRISATIPKDYKRNLWEKCLEKYYFERKCWTKQRPLNNGPSKSYVKGADRGWKSLLSRPSSRNDTYLRFTLLIDWKSVLDNNRWPIKAYFMVDVG